MNRNTHILFSNRSGYKLTTTGEKKNKSTIDLRYINIPSTFCLCQIHVNIFETFHHISHAYT